MIVISIGNIAFGGRGKTPAVSLTARLLRDMGERVAILSRGYGRRTIEDGVTVVSDGTHLLADLDRAGDEPLMLARELPGVAVLVCDQRAVAGALAQHALGATVAVLDDGFQHRQMRRDVDVVLVTPGDLSGRRAPLGRLREGPAALARADAVIVDAGDGAAPAGPLRGPAGTAACFRLRRRTRLPDAVPPGTRVFVLAGIAGPDRVVSAAAAAGAVVAGHWAPGDHHRYRAGDVARLARDAQAAGAGLVLTTAKDAERLRPFRPLPFAAHVLEHTVAIEADAGGQPFDAWLRRRVTDHRRLDPGEVQR